MRAAFDETRWSAWNPVRVALSIASSVLLAWAMVVQGRDATVT